MKELENRYEGNSDFWFLSNFGQIPDYWIKKAQYGAYKDFLPLFDDNLGTQEHTDHGGAVLCFLCGFLYSFGRFRS